MEDRFDIEFKPKTREQKRSLKEKGYFELSKSKAIEYFKSYRQLLPQGLNLDEVQYGLENGTISLVYCEKYENEKVNDVCVFFKTNDSANKAWLPLGINKPDFPPVETSIREAVRKYESRILQTQKWKDRVNKRRV